MKNRINKKYLHKYIEKITITFIVICFTFVPVYADVHGPNNIVYTPYGTCTQEFYYDVNGPLDISIGGITFPSVYACNVIRYQFTKPTDGVFDLAVTPYTGVLDHQWYLYTTNCYLVSVTQDGKLRFAVEDQEYCEIAILTPNYNNQLVLFLQNQQLTQSDTTNQVVNEMAQYVEYIDGYIFEMKSDLGTIENILLRSLGGYVSNNGSLYTDLQDIKTALTQAYNEDVLIYEQLQALDIYKSLIYQLMTENDRYVQYTNRYRIYGDVYLYDHTKNTSTQDWRNSFYIPSGKTYSFIFYTVGSLGGSYNVYSRDNSIVINVYERQIASAKYIYEFNIKNNSASSNPVAIEFTKDIWFVPIWLGNANLMPIQVQQMIGVNYGDMYTAKMQDVINAINNMSVSVNNMTVNATGITYNVNNTQVDNSVTTYNTNIEYVYSVENNFGQSLDTQLQAYQVDNTSIITRLTTTGNFMATVLNGINEIEIFTIPLGIALVGIVLIAIVG